MTRSRRNGPGKNTITNVRVVDELNGSDSVRVDRMLSEFSRSAGQMRVVCTNRQETGFATSPTSGFIGTATLLGTDDFVSFAAQYTEFRIKAMRFEVVDLFGSAGASNFWGTSHQVDSTAASGIEDVVDRPDSRSIAPGDGKQSFYWLAHGNPETEFQNVGTPDTFGGLVYYLGSTSTAQQGRYSVITKFVVDFRGKR